MTDQPTTKCWAGYEDCLEHPPFWVLLNGRWVRLDDPDLVDREEQPE